MRILVPIAFAGRIRTVASSGLGVGDADGRKMATTDDKPLTGPVFAAAGEDGMRCVSRDGRVWTNIQHGRDGESYSAIAFGNGRCVVAGRFGGSAPTAATEDGAAWQAATYDAKYSNYIQTLVFFKDRFLGIGGNFFIESDDGLKWGPTKKFPEKKALFGIDPTLHRFALGNGVLAGVGDFGNTIVTHDGRDWTFAPHTKPADALIDITFGNGMFVAGGLHGLRMRSQDGLTWTDRTPGEEGEHINFINFDGKRFVGVGQGATYISEDGLKWERIPNQSAPTIAAFGNDTYVGALWPGKLLRSTDGIKWEDVVELPQSVAALAFGDLGKK